MGEDFSALLECRGIGAAVERVITRLESGLEPPELARLTDFARGEGFAFADRRWPVKWFRGACGPLPSRPALPDLPAGWRRPQVAHYCGWWRPPRAVR